MLLKQYQEKYVQTLLNTTLRLVVDDGSKSIIFKAPTGSGKTVMMQEYLRRLADVPQDREFAVLWISVNDLSRQSKKSFERHLADSSLRFSELSDISDREIKKNEILFINWESIKSVDRTTGEWKVLAMRDNERDENLPTYLENTHQAGREIILVVDESHRSLDTTKAQELIMWYIKPKLQIEVSATPDGTDYDVKIEVKVEEVIEAGMIKKEVRVNPGIAEVWGEIEETDKFIIGQALEKAATLRAKYEAIGSPVRPLVLIQLPSETRTTTQLDQTKLSRTRQVLAEDFGISIENKKLAIWLSNEKSNLENIESYDSSVEVLIFKQAIATGWDCPRAQILVMFREIGSIVFEIQTVGRILRMPEQKHYDDPDLDVAYVYTDLERAHIGIHEMAKNLIKDRFSTRNEGYQSIGLASDYLKRVEYNDLGLSFYGVLADTFLDCIGSDRKTAPDENVAKLSVMGVETRHSDLQNRLISNGKILVDIDAHTGDAIYSETTVATKTEKELVQLTFDAFCREQVKPEFTNIARSYKAIVEALYIMLEEYVFGREYGRYRLQCLILSNKGFFIDVLRQAKQTYQPIRRKEGEIRNPIFSRTWEVPTITAFPEWSLHMDVKKSIVEPFYATKLSTWEERFITEYLEKNPAVLWWYRNGVKSEQFFSLVYRDADGERKNFFPDFIVQYADGAIGIFDPKDGFTLEQDRPKHVVLSAYIAEHGTSVPMIVGFVREAGGVFYRSLHDGYDVANLDGWGRLL